MLPVLKNFKCLKSLTSCLFANNQTILSPLASVPNHYVPTRQSYKIYRRKPFDNYWVPRKRKYTDDKITKENQEFLQEVMKEKFLKPGESPLKESVTTERAQWTPESMRPGLIARKIGIYPMWTKDGTKIMTTLLQVVDNHVIRYNPPELFQQSKYHDQKLKDKSRVLGSLVVGAESADPQLFTAAYNGLFSEAGVMPKRKLTRFRITPDAKIEPGTPLFVNHFRVGDYVNVLGITRYHGFQGVVRRWGFKGGPASHGNTKSHNRPGCIGSGRRRGVWKGKKMPGRMGGYRHIQCGLKIWRINTKHNVIYVHGPAVPGPNKNYVSIYDSYVPKKGHTTENPPPFPTFYPEDADGPLPENIYDEELHNFSDPSITVKEEVAKAKK